MTALTSARRDDSQDLVSNETATLFNNVRSAIFIPILIFVGIPTNLLSVWVFVKQGLGQRINSCLFCLSLVDLLFLLAVLLLHINDMQPGALSRSAMITPVGPLMAFIYDYRLIGLMGLTFASMFVSTVIACERCLCVMLPLRSGSLLRTSTTRVVLALGVILTTGGMFVISEKFRLRCVVDVTTGEEWLMTTIGSFYFSNKPAVDFLDHVVYGTVIPFVTVGGVALTTGITVVKLVQVVRSRQVMSSSSAALSPREVALTRMLVLLSVQFVVLNSSNIVFRVTRLLFTEELDPIGRWSNLYKVEAGLMELCYTLNASTNFVVYVLAGSKYRATVRELFHCGKRARPLSSFVHTDKTSDGFQQGRDFIIGDMVNHTE